MIHAVLFDLDGTLIDTNELIIDSFKHTFEFFNKSIPTREDIIDCFGEPLHGTMSKFFDDGEQAVKVYREFNLKYHDERIDSYGNAKEMLKALKDKGIKLGIVTSKNKNIAIFTLYMWKDSNKTFKFLFSSQLEWLHPPRIIRWYSQSEGDSWFL